MHDSEECFFNNKEEEQFLFSLLKPEMEVLEWGSGSSTRAIAKRVSTIVSIEHDRKWFDKVLAQNLPNNVQYHFVPRNREERRGHDGTYEDYYDYIKFPTMLAKRYDIIFVDGRARVECARQAIDLLKGEGSILIHDIFNPDAKCDRSEYWEVLNFLHPIAGEYALWQFKPKRNL